MRSMAYNTAEKDGGDVTAGCWSRSTRVVHHRGEVLHVVGLEREIATATSLPESTHARDEVVICLRVDRGSGGWMEARIRRAVGEDRWRWWCYCCRWWWFTLGILRSDCSSVGLMVAWYLVCRYGHNCTMWWWTRTPGH
ncbi:extensin [Iris pallida]|uniref:Extensin n=1 Tax=Iris pallida TaxID=29817 RepID=A0AAX6FE33_IRIPA|nr:extensin [Iris pallida]